MILFCCERLVGGGTSMLHVAKVARASHETLYRGNGDTGGLCTAMLRTNAAETHALLSAALDRREEPWRALASVAPAFLQMFLGDRAILLNRAAADDPSGVLGAALSAGERSEIMPLLSQVIAQICAGRAVDPEDATGWFLAHLIGDLQVRRIIHDCAAPGAPEIEHRCGKAVALLRQLLSDPLPRIPGNANALQ